MITVLGASGHTGSVIAERLLALEEFVRVVGRDERRLASFEARGAELAVGDIADTPFLTKALSGADAAWLLIPPAYTEPDYLAYMDRLAGSIEHAVRDSEISHVALLSSMGADLPEGTGLVTGLHAMEARLRELTAVNSLFLRAGYFYENLFGSLEFIAAQGVNGGVIAPDVPVTMVASRDVGEIAARALRSRDFSGVAVRSAVGPRDYTMREVTRILGGAIGRPELDYSQLPAEGVARALQQSGMSADSARLLVEMGEAINAGRMNVPEERTEDNTGPTTFEDFAPALAAAFRSP